MTDTKDKHNKKKVEKKIDETIAKVTKEFGTIQPKERNAISNNPKLADTAKTRIIAEMDEFENYFHENITRQRPHFISILQGLINTGNLTPEDEDYFAKKIVGEYAASMSACKILTIRQARQI